MVMTGQRAACWAVVTKNGRFGYVTDAGTGNISGFAIGRDRSASLFNDNGVTAVMGGNRRTQHCRVIAAISMR
jgi:hypothetical protein